VRETAPWRRLKRLALDLQVRFDLLGCSRYLGAKLNRAPIRKSLRIRPGDVVGVIAPAGAVDGERL